MEVIFKIMSVKGLGREHAECKKTCSNMSIYIYIQENIDRKARKANETEKKNNLKVTEIAIEAI